METRATITRSPSSTLTKMHARAVLLVCCVVGSTVAYYPQRQPPYNTGPNDLYSVEVNSNFLPEQSQRLFFGNGQGSNQVGGSGLWASLTNKFPWLGNMFGRMELAPEYGVPQVSTQYGAPARFQPQYYQPQVYTPQTYQAPQTYQVPQTYQAPQTYQFRQTYQAPQTYYQQPSQFGRILPGGRDVGLTDDAVIVTPPQVPVMPVQPVQPVRPVQPPQPVPPQPAPETEGYSYNKPQYRLELPHK